MTGQPAFRLDYDSRRQRAGQSASIQQLALRFAATRSLPLRPYMLAGDSSVHRLLRGIIAVWRGWQLQHCCVLTFIEAREQHGFSTWEFERIVMHLRLVRVHLPEASYLVADSLFTHPACGKPTFELDLVIKRNLRAGKKAHCHVWFSDRGKTARNRVVELRRYKLVSDLCGPGCHVVQTVVAH